MNDLSLIPASAALLLFVCAWFARKDEKGQSQGAILRAGLWIGSAAFMYFACTIAVLPTQTQLYTYPSYTVSNATINYTISPQNVSVVEPAVVSASNYQFYYFVWLIWAVLCATLSLAAVLGMFEHLG